MLPGHIFNGLLQFYLRPFIPVNNNHLFRPAVHAADKVEQVFLIRVSGVAANVMDAPVDVNLFAVEVDVAVFGAMILNLVARGTFGLVANKDDIGSWIR